MTSEQWRLVYEIFQAASDLPQEQQLGYIESRTSDPEVRDHVLALFDDLVTTGEPDPLSIEKDPQTQPGSHIGRYVIQNQLGRGGMGIVCAAFDSELQRRVALKFLPSSSIGSTSSFEEFLGHALREAQAISSLNHPNIVTVHEVLRVEGGKKAAIVMELVDGEPLRTRAKTPQPIQAIAAWGLQIARGLAAAHERGIIHRDIKPENLILRSDGLIKILDFGLARQTGAEDSLEDLPMGTLGYMSPEQLRGDSLTPATDLFSLGVVLWELATGAHPFRADTALATTAAIARAELELGLPPSYLSRPLERILRRLMSRNPTDRPTAAGLVTELSGMTERRKKLPARWLLVAACSLVVATASLAWVYYSSRDPGVSIAAVSPSIVPFTSYQGSETDPAFSPDGQRVAFAWTGQAGRNRNIYIRPTDSESLTPLTAGTAEDFAPVWSPDGSRIAFLRRSLESNDPMVMIAAVSGGPLTVAGQIANPEGYPRPIAWWPDGQSLLVRDATDRGIALVRLRIADGVRTVLTNPVGTGIDGLPVLSPSGKRFAFVRLRVNSAATCLLDLDGKVDCPHTVQMEQGDSINGLIGGLAWLPDDKGLFYCDKSALWRMDFSPQLTVTKIMPGSFPGLTGSPRGHRLAFHKEYSDTNLWRLHNGTDTPLRSINSSASESDPAFSPDGRSLCFRSNRTGTFELWIAASDGTGLRQVTSMGGHLGSPRWSPDGRWIAFDAYGSPSDKTKYTNIYVIPSAGGTPHRITSDQAESIVPNWSNDQKFIYYMADQGAQVGTWKIPFPLGAPIRVANFGMFDLAESADGSHLYYAKARGEAGLFRRAVEGGAEETLPQTSDVRLIRYWQLATRGIFFASGPLDPKLLLLNMSTNRLRTIGTMTGSLTRGIRGLTVSPDGSSAVYVSEDLVLADISFVEKLF